MMKRIIAILLLVVIGMTLVSCAPDACEACGAEGGKIKKINVKAEGKKMWLCETCYAAAEFTNKLIELAE